MLLLYVTQCFASLVLIQAKAFFVEKKIAERYCSNMRNCKSMKNVDGCCHKLF